MKGIDFFFSCPGYISRCGFDASDQSMWLHFAYVVCCWFHRCSCCRSCCSYCRCRCYSQLFVVATGVVFAAFPLSFRLSSFFFLLILLFLLSFSQRKSATENMRVKVYNCITQTMHKHYYALLFCSSRSPSRAIHRPLRHLVLGSHSLRHALWVSTFRRN